MGSGGGSRPSRRRRVGDPPEFKEGMSIKQRLVGETAPRATRLRLTATTAVCLGVVAACGSTPPAHTPPPSPSATPGGTGHVFDVTQYGGRGDDVSDNTHAFADCHRRSRGRGRRGRVRPRGEVCVQRGQDRHRRFGGHCGDRSDHPGGRRPRPDLLDRSQGEQGPPRRPRRSQRRGRSDARYADERRRRCAVRTGERHEPAEHQGAWRSEPFRDLLRRTQRREARVAALQHRQCRQRSRI